MTRSARFRDNTQAVVIFLLLYLFSKFPELDNRWSKYACDSWWHEYRRLIQLLDMEIT